MSFFDIEHIAFTVLGYDLSYVELIATLFGLISVFLAAKGNILTWPTGIINEAALFILFFQVQLYSDMYLQVYFFGVTIYGWYYWKKQRTSKTVNVLSKKWRLSTLVILVAASLISGYYMSQIHLYFPNLFSEPSAYPYWDALTTMGSIIATILLARWVIETWILWMMVDIVAIVLYLLKGIHLLAIEYLIFLIICMAGFANWKKKL